MRTTLRNSPVATEVQVICWGQVPGKSRRVAVGYGAEMTGEGLTDDGHTRRVAHHAAGGLKGAFGVHDLLGKLGRGSLKRPNIDDHRVGVTSSDRNGRAGEDLAQSVGPGDDDPGEAFYGNLLAMSLFRARRRLELKTTGEEAAATTQAGLGKSSLGAPSLNENWVRLRISGSNRDASHSACYA
ncbi:MAG: hypothetical protein P8O03_02795 [Ilumatobacter sp.]|nr:hypothetical protein [Ilumatobacter sp.]